MERWLNRLTSGRDRGMAVSINGGSCRYAVAALMLAIWLPAEGAAQTLERALAQAYRGNETLNAERASLRATDEEVPQALSGYRPRVDATADAGRRYLDEKGADGTRQTSTATPRGVGLTATQTLFNGFQTANRVRMAESQVFGRGGRRSGSSEMIAAQASDQECCRPARHPAGQSILNACGPHT